MKKYLVALVYIKTIVNFKTVETNSHLYTNIIEAENKEEALGIALLNGVDENQIEGYTLSIKHIKEI